MGIPACSGDAWFNLQTADYASDRWHLRGTPKTLNAIKTCFDDITNYFASIKPQLAYSKSVA